MTKADENVRSRGRANARSSYEKSSALSRRERNFARLSTSFVLLTSLTTLGCGKKAKECDSLISSMNQLGEQVANAQRTADRPDAKPGDLIAVLRPLATSAKALSEKLKREAVETASVKKLATDFEKFASNLSVEANKIAVSAASLESASVIAEGLEIAQKNVEKSQAELEKYCTGTPAACVPIAELLTKLPAGPSSADDTAMVKKWQEELTQWLGKLQGAAITDASLKPILSEFELSWKKVAEKMGELSSLTETARTVEAAGKRFDILIDEANLVITAANRECGREEKK